MPASRAMNSLSNPQSISCLMYLVDIFGICAAGIDSPLVALQDLQIARLLPNLQSILSPDHLTVTPQNQGKTRRAAKAVKGQLSGRNRAEP